MQDFRSLKVWRKAHTLTLDVYRATRGFPSDERFGLTAQLRRGAASIASNIAEGCGRGSDPDFGRFLQMAIGSATEIEYQFLLARDLAYLDCVDYRRLDAHTIEVRRMLVTLLQRIKRNPPASRNSQLAARSS
ncbi:MAG: four helix bundle protein [Deltaproteobacteria bacterium]|nr:four helix bundle protein [Deltaproteobacteria bacterium]